MTALDRIRIRLAEAEACRAMLVFGHPGIDTRVATWRDALEEALAASTERNGRAEAWNAYVPPLDRAEAPEAAAIASAIGMPAAELARDLAEAPPTAASTTHETPQPSADAAQDHAEAAREASVAPPPAEASSAPAPPAPRPRQVRRKRASALFSDERSAKLAEMWTQPIVIETIFEAVSALPGPALRDTKQLHNRARDMHLPSRPRVLSDQTMARLVEAGRANATHFTAERDDKLREMWAKDAAPADILAAMNALPGPAIMQMTSIYQRARRLELPKRDLSKRLAADRLRKLRASEAGQPKTWTPERLAILARMTLEGARDAAILEAVNALPGRPVASSGALRKQRAMLPGPAAPAQPEPAAPPEPAEALSPKPFTAPHSLTAAEVYAKPAPAPTQAPPAPTAAPPSLPAPSAQPAQERPEDRLKRQEDKALAILRDGMSEHVAAQHTNLPLDHVARLAARIAQEADAAQEARYAKARAMLAKPTDPSIVVAHTRLPLREVYRLQAEIRSEGRAA